MLVILLSSLALVAQEPSPKVEGGQLVNIVRGAYAGLNGYSFVYEGERRLVRAATSQEDQDSSYLSYQGIYAYRFDGSTYLDVYLKGRSEPAHLVRSKGAIFRDKTELVAFEPDSRSARSIRVLQRNPYALERESPQKIMYHWFFQAVADASALNYEFLGWEPQDGRSCLKAKLDLSPSPPGSKSANSAYVFWIDLERGGNPLRVDYLARPPHVAERVHDIKLERFEVPGRGPIWFPISGILDTFVIDANSYSDTPILQESYVVVRRTLRFNQDMPNSMFTVKWKGETAGSRELVLRKEFDEAATHPAPALRNDPASVRATLDRRLAEAESQSRMLEASSAARETRDASLLLLVAVVLGGLACLVAAVLLRRRYR